MHNAWKSAEPGVLFWDTIIRESVPDCYADLGYKTVSTNPCGEIPLCPYDSCRLLAINLYSYVVNPFTKDAYFDFDLFHKHVALAQRIMDDIIDLELEKIERIIEKIDQDPENEEVKHTERGLWKKIYKKSGQGRRTGVGITAEGDMLRVLWPYPLMNDKHPERLLCALSLKTLSLLLFHNAFRERQAYRLRL